MRSHGAVGPMSVHGNCCLYKIRRHGAWVCKGRARVRPKARSGKPGTPAVHLRWGEGDGHTAACSISKPDLALLPNEPGNVRVLNHPLSQQFIGSDVVDAHEQRFLGKTTPPHHKGTWSIRQVLSPARTLCCHLGSELNVQVVVERRDSQAQCRRQPERDTNQASFRGTHSCTQKGYLRFTINGSV